MWPLRRPLEPDKQGYGASSGVWHPEGIKLEALEADGEDVSHELNRFTSESRLIASNPFITSEISLREQDGRVEIYVGKSKVFIADSDGEATAFVKGFLPYANKND